MGRNVPIPPKRLDNEMNVYASLQADGDIGPYQTPHFQTMRHCRCFIRQRKRRRALCSCLQNVLLNIQALKKGLKNLYSPLCR